MSTDAHGSGWRRGGAWAGALALLMLAGCSLPQAQPDLTRYYVLTGQSTARPETVPGATVTRKVNLKAVHVPEFLRGKIMQVRLAENEVKYIDAARWAEPLEAGLGRVLREGLESAGGVEIVSRSVDARDFDVVVHVRQCEGVVPAKMARIAARVEVFTGGVESRRVVEREFVTEVPDWDGDDYGQLAAKLSEAARALAAKIGALLAETGGNEN